VIRAGSKTLVIGLVWAALLSACTGSASPKRTISRGLHHLAAENAAQLVATIQQGTPELYDCLVPLNVSPYGASGDLQCMFDGKPVRFLSFSPPATPPTAVPGLWNRTVLFAPTWLVIATSLSQAQAIQRIIGGRLYLTPVVVAPRSVKMVGSRPRSCPIGCLVRFRVSVRNPMDRQAVFSCHARGLSADGNVLFREPGIASEILQPPTDAGAVTQLSGVAHTERPGTVAKVIAWCTARPLTQPQ
jgi:hypothetical protein